MYKKKTGNNKKNMQNFMVLFVFSPLISYLCSNLEIIQLFYEKVSYY